MIKYNSLKEYLKTNNFPIQSNLILSKWTVKQRQNKKNGKLSKERIQLLEELNGWFWEKNKVVLD
jgi:hypothetical protein